jgi:polyribonucleotide nucleotidyltransferase
VCGGVLAMLDAGVPVRPVAGVALGLVEGTGA